MIESKMGFSAEAKSGLDNYIYRLVDPRNGETFYVGRGVNDRVFDHIRCALKFGNDPDEQTDEETEKYATIRQIQDADLEVIHVIHRHGLDVETSRHVEAALIDAYPGTTNKQGGYLSNEFGPMNVKEIERKYKTDEADFDGIKVVMISIRRSDATLSVLDVHGAELIAEVAALFVSRAGVCVYQRRFDMSGGFHV